MSLNLFLKALLIIAMAGTLGALIAGVWTLSKRGKDADLKSNKLMQLRIFFQALAILIFTLLLLMKVH